MLTVLIGGGRDEEQVRHLLAPFLAAVTAAGTGGEVASVVVDDGEGVDLPRWRGLLADAASVRDVVLSPGRPLRAEDLDGVAGVFVAGGLTPLYAELVVPQRDLLAALPYAGFSTGAAIAADRALVGGWRHDGRPVCSEDAGEDLDDLTVVPGLGRVPFAVDVHAAQWGTLSRAVAAVAAGLVPAARAVDEHTAVVVHDGAVEVAGVGQALEVTPTPDGVRVR
jgi:cyanophycinase